MFWAFDPKTRDANENLAISSSSMLECYDNIPNIVKKYSDDQIKRLEANNVSPQDAKAEVEEKAK